MAKRFLGLAMGALVAATALGAGAAERQAGQTIKLGPELKLTAPADWVSKRPKVAIIEYEFAVPAAEGDKEDGRVTVMQAGGSVEANVDRWYGQFVQPDGSASSKKGKLEKKKLAGREVQILDISGTYKDARGPFAPVVERPDYRMLAAVIPTDQGNYFIKFYGPKRTVGAQAAAFQKMLAGLK